MGTLLPPPSADVIEVWPLPKANLMLPRPMREFIWTDVMYNPNMERTEGKRGRHIKKARVGMMHLKVTDVNPSIKKEYLLKNRPNYSSPNINICWKSKNT